ncbi:MAG: hypothetical protein R2912_10640 [Eubacteriales bacterium]
MMKINITNLEAVLLDRQQQRSGSVKLIAEREPEELKGNSFIQNLLLDTQNADIFKLSIETNSERDTIRLIRFMMEDGRSLDETTGFFAHLRGVTNLSRTVRSLRRQKIHRRTNPRVGAETTTE